MPRKPKPQKVLHLAGAIEAEMRRIGMWSETPPTDEQMDFQEAFARDTMPFAGWLQFVFLPRVREAAEANEFPSSSSVGAYAVREWDGHPEAGQLITLLSEFDPLFG